MATTTKSGGKTKLFLAIVAIAGLFLWAPGMIDLDNITPQQTENGHRHESVQFASDWYPIEGAEVAITFWINGVDQRAPSPVFSPWFHTESAPRGSNYQLEVRSNKVMVRIDCEIWINGELAVNDRTQNGDLCDI